LLQDSKEAYHVDPLPYKVMPAKQQPWTGISQFYGYLLIIYLLFSVTFRQSYQETVLPHEPPSLLAPALSRSPDRAQFRSPIRPALLLSHLQGTSVRRRCRRLYRVQTDMVRGKGI
jgi:hypothetical protein